MATVVELERAGALFKLDPDLEAGIQELRCIYGSPTLKTWIEGTLPGLEGNWGLELTPLEQLQGFVEEVFCPGEPLTFEWQFKPLIHIRDGIWELKTADLRMFGWFWKQDCFIASACDLKSRILEYKLYRPYADDAARFRSALDLDEPKFIPGDDPRAVVSDFSYP